MSRFSLSFFKSPNFANLILLIFFLHIYEKRLTELLLRSNRRCGIGAGTIMKPNCSVRCTRIQKLLPMLHYSAEFGGALQYDTFKNISAICSE